MATIAPTLDERPDWRYLLNEIYRIYRHSSAGGSPPIRAHHRLVRARLNRAMTENPFVLERKPRRKPVCAHLGRALDNGKRFGPEAIVRTVETVAPALVWRYGYRSMPGKLSRNFAYAEFLGPYGPVMAEDLVLGCVLFAPRTTYPSHAHVGVTESYICLSGAMSQNDVAVYTPGSMILNTPDFDHKITTCSLEPTLLLYAWTGTIADLAEQEMTFRRPRPRGRKLEIDAGPA